MNDPIALKILDEALFEASLIEGVYRAHDPERNGDNLYGIVEMTDGRLFRLTVEEVPW